jgi:hypothetical protein
MVITNYGKSRIALIVGGSSTEIPSWMMIGSGSGIALSTETTLIYPTDRQIFTEVNNTTTQKIGFVGDWTTIEVSGLDLREHGITISGAGTTGSVWSRTTYPAINFDGTNELRIEETWEVY